MSAKVYSTPHFAKERFERTELMRSLQVPPRPPKKYRHTSVCLYFFVFGVVDENAFILRDPNETQQSGFVGKRSRSKVSEFSDWSRNERYGACGDAERTNREENASESRKASL